MQTGLKRAEQAQPSSSARSCRCYSREWEEADPVARSRALLRRVSDATFGGLGARRTWGRGRQRRGRSGSPRPSDSRPRGPGGAAAPLPRCPARQAAPIRPRAISVGRRAGIRAAPPPPALRKLGAPTARDRRTRARAPSPHSPARSPAQRPRPPLTAAGSSEGSAPAAAAAAAGREGARA